MRTSNGSTIKWVNALSGVAIATVGSTNAVNYAGYESGMLIINTGSAPSGAGMAVRLLRSATSDGTFQTFGASIPGNNANNTTGLRSFLINTSATWHKAYYENSGGSFIGNIAVQLFNARNRPVVSQESNVSVYSDVLSG